MEDFAKIWVDLAQPRLGTEVVFATDDFFAAKERLIDPAEPVFIPGKYDENGKWMDGWESRRRRDAAMMRASCGSADRVSSMASRSIRAISPAIIRRRHRSTGAIRANAIRKAAGSRSFRRPRSRAMTGCSSASRCPMR